VVAVRARPKDQDNWSVIGSEKVLEVTNRMRVTRQTVRLPDDRMVDDYYQIDLPSFASVYAVNEKDEVLLLRQYKHGVGQVCLTLPGGQVEPGEDIEFSARRELLEETGYGGGKWLTGPSLVLHGNQRIARSHIFVACHVIKIGQAKSGDLEETTLHTLPRKSMGPALLNGMIPIASHAAAISVAELLLGKSTGR
jgi:ADP-ribose pyrophosphatase